MDFVYCPNGHANRPGTRICAVCRALVEQRVPQPAAAPPPPREPADPRPVESYEAAPRAHAEPATELVAPPKKRSWLWLWLLLLLGLCGLLALAVLAFFYPLNRTQQEQPTPIVATSVAVIIDNTPEPIPTDLPLPTATTEALPSPTELAEEPSPTNVPTITPLSTIVGVVITPTFSFAPGMNLLQNGDFADDWANGWTSEMNGDSNLVDVRPVNDDPDANMVHLEQTGPGYLRIAQRVVLTYPVEGLEFQTRVRAAGAGNGAAEGQGALILQYEDFNGEPIGASIWTSGSAASDGLWDTLLAPLAGLPFAEHALDESWQTLTVDLGRQFADELTGLSPMDVFQLTVILAVANSDACEPAGCEAMIEATDLLLAPNLP